MADFEKQDGVAFFLIHFTHRDMLYYLPFRHLQVFWERAQSGGRKSFRIDELDLSYELKHKAGLFVPYLDTLQKDLNERELLDDDTDSTE